MSNLHRELEGLLRGLALGEMATLWRLCLAVVHGTWLAAGGKGDDADVMGLLELSCEELSKLLRLKSTCIGFPISCASLPCNPSLCNKTRHPPRHGTPSAVIPPS